MDKEKGKILVLVEGQRTDYKLMEHLLNIYGISEKHEIVSYNTNIYTLYNEMFKEKEPESRDLLLTLAEHERDTAKKSLFKRPYSDILLIFDFDPQDSQFSEQKIREMSCYFTESSEMGKLYLNYPMVEAFYHMKSIPDENYTSYLATLEELRNHTYKSRVQRENRNHSYQKFAINKAECDLVIWQNIQKAWCVAENRLPTLQSPLLPDLIDVLLAQIEHMRERQAVMVLCTCAFYVVDYNPNLLNKQDDGVKNACIINRSQSL